MYSKDIYKDLWQNHAMKKLLLFLPLFLLASCGSGGVSKSDVTKACSTISNSYVDSQLRRGIFNEDPRFKNLLIELREKNGETDHEYIEMLSGSIYTNIALGALNKNRSYPNFYEECVFKLSKDFGVY